MRGRVMSLWAVVFLGSTPIGAPLIGFLAGRYGARFALGVGGLATLLIAVWAGFALRRIRNTRRLAARVDLPMDGGAAIDAAGASYATIGRDVLGGTVGRGR
jgi:MFS family permease